jgi:hypothetical protein
MLRLQTVGVAYEHSNARSVVGRLRAMKGIAVVGDDDVEFCDTAERATGCHRFAAALRDGGAAELAAVSEDFERMGDLVAAVDAQMRWPHTAGASAPPRFVRPASGCC